MCRLKRDLLHTFIEVSLTYDDILISSIRSLATTTLPIRCQTSPVR